MTPIARGVLLAVAAAAAFGATTPVVQQLAAGAGAPATAALLYLGATGFALASRRRGHEIRLDRSWWPRVLSVGLSGAFVAPIALAAGLARTNGTTASLLLNLEAVFTVALGAAFWREPVGGRVAAAVAVIAGGGALVGLDQGGDGGTSWLGRVLIAVATLAWATDNTLSRPLSDLDPADVVAAKGAVGVAASVLMAVATGAAWPAAPHALGIAACGAIGFGASLRLYLRAQLGVRGGAVPRRARGGAARRAARRVAHRGRRAGDGPRRLAAPRRGPRAPARPRAAGPRASTPPRRRPPRRPRP
jgi:drug/metabolite transporter (DMT)-like permease